jgi:hypothetical protein
VRELEALDRSAVRHTALERFSGGRMVDEYEAVYRRLASSAAPGVAHSATQRSSEPIPITSARAVAS